MGGISGTLPQSDLAGMGLFGLVHTLPAHQFVIIHLMTIKIRPVDTGEFGLSADRNAASPAHPGPIHHNGIERYIGLEAPRLGEKADELHHDDGPNRDDLVIFLTRFNKLF